ncbi:MAG: hypothetical protein BHV95_13320 [Clostridiales bacterium Nov_37_41]|nr:MAG: hypothetical protein BHV95_13320 [Clostridiales bacterium Nov_37_41]
MKNYEKETEMLCKQMNLLAEQSKEAVDLSEITALSTAMCEVHNTLIRKTLLTISIACIFVVIANLTVNFIILIKKFFGSKTC